MDAWSWAGEVRVYVAALRQAATEQIGREPDGRLARWLKWAQQYAELVDPLEQPETLPLDGSSSPVFSRFCRVVRRTFWPSTVCCARDQVGDVAAALLISRLGRGPGACCWECR